MGHKVNPIGLRLGVVKSWDSIWYVDKKYYIKALHEDLKIRLENSKNLIQSSKNEIRRIGDRKKQLL